jgi:hypothetical protein
MPVCVEKDGKGGKDGEGMRRGEGWIVFTFLKT